MRSLLVPLAWGLALPVLAGTGGDKPVDNRVRYDVVLLAPYTGPLPAIAASSAGWRCDADLRHCHTVAPRGFLTVAWCQRVVPTLGWVTAFGHAEGGALTRAQLAECNRSAPNRPERLRDGVGRDAGLPAAGASQPRRSRVPERQP